MDTDGREDVIEDRPELVLDEFDEKLEAFNVLRKSDRAAADRILDQVGATDGVDRQIILELASKRPLGHADRFPQAHAGAMRALEVLDRNGSSGHPDLGARPPGPGGPVHRPAGGPLPGQVPPPQRDQNLSNLYSRREAASLKDDPHRPLLARARIQTDRVANGYKGNPLGFPTFILGGAFLSTIIGSLQGVVLSAVDSLIGQIILVLALFGVMVAASWALLKGAAIAPPTDQVDHRPAAGGAVPDRRPLRPAAPGSGPGLRPAGPDPDGHRLDRRPHRPRRVVTDQL